MNKDLPFAAEELKMLQNLCSSLHLKPITPLKRKEDVLKRLKDCRIFHFAGHGQLDLAEPSQSRLLLEDWETNPLTIGDIRDLRLQENPPFLGYLSACSTSANESAKFIDEAINFVNACQLAGFRHVIGTLWEVYDKHCVVIAEALYETILAKGMTDAAIYLGLHRAIRALRDEQLDTGPTESADIEEVEEAITQSPDGLSPKEKYNFVRSRPGKNSDDSLSLGSVCSFRRLDGMAAIKALFSVYYGRL